MNTLDDLLLGILVGTIVLFTSTFVRNDRFTCPGGFYAEGVRPNGDSQCRQVPPAGCGEPRPPNDRPCVGEGYVIPSKVYCTNGTSPILVNERTVGCQ